MIRFTDIVPVAEPKKAARPTREREPAAKQAAPAASDTAKPAKAPRKAKTST